MGLDMYINATCSEIYEDVDFDAHHLDNIEVAYWRKHPNLHGLFYLIYLKKGGKNPDFNGNTLKLTLDDLGHIETNILCATLPETEGFFFGKSSHSEEQAQLDLKQLERVRELILAGKNVYYAASY